MRIRNFAILGLFLFGVGSLAFRGHGEETKSELLMQLIVQGLNNSHYAPGQIDDDFSMRVYDLYVKRMDYNKRYFTQADINEFQSYKLKIDDQVNDQNYDFFDLSEQVLTRRIEMVKGFYKEILIQPMDFTVDEEIFLEADEVDWAKDEKELKERWRKVLKWQVLNRLVTQMNMQEKEKSDDEEIKAADPDEKKTFTEMEQEARQKVMKTYDDWVRRVDKLDKNDRRNVFINAIANSYDPHTGYYPPKDKENFDIQMSGKLEGIGATLQEKDGYIKVVRIVAGSACYRQGELEEDNIILKVAQGANEPVDIVDMRLDDAVKLIRGKKGSEVRLTVKQGDGVTKVIPIIRDVVILEETFAKSAIIKNEHVPGGVGYIKLPKFYADFNDRNGRSCATDVKKEIEALTAQGVDGLVLDLRNNGGGSLYDVVKMAGLFIDKGPIVQIKDRYRGTQILDDQDATVQYDGPLVVMVNSSSASASEIMAAAIQDYKRGVVVGTPTFGKGTVQRFLNLDNFVRGDAGDVKPLGAIKLTTQKFYRINGGATQLKGVTPDVILPDAYTYIDRGEKEQDHCMPWDEIKAANYKTWGLAQGEYSKIRRNSRDRLKSDPVFQMVEQNAQRMKRTRDRKSQSLNLETYRANQKRIKDEANKYKEIFQPIEGVSITNLTRDMEHIQSDTVRQKLNEEWIKSLQKDAYVNEVTAILKDLK